MVSPKLSVARRSPKRIKNTPPTIETALRYFEIFSIYTVAFEKRAAMARNGSASPAENTVSIIPPWSAVPDVPARRRTEPKMGPTHGVQPKAKAPPIKIELEGVPSVNHLGMGMRFSV